jgi:hypothetical protein
MSTVFKLEDLGWFLEHGMGTWVREWYIKGKHLLLCREDGDTTMGTVTYGEKHCEVDACGPVEL